MENIDLEHMAYNLYAIECPQIMFLLFWKTRNTGCAGFHLMICDLAGSIFTNAD